MGLFLVFNLAILISFCSVSCETDVQVTQTFIIRVQHDLKPSQFSTLEEWYTSTLTSLQSKTPIPFQPANSTDNILHVYKTVFHGFSATLTRDHARELETRPEILGVFPDNIRKVQTTRTPHFLGLDTGKAFYGLLNESDYGSDVIIGLLDTGIWPEHPSFNDEDMDPVPARWKGKCQEGEQFPKTTCNKKLIGARYFSAGHERSISQGNKNDGYKSARDSSGHGTHTASTAAGRAVKNASCLGFASGQANGIALKARIAVYKVCWLGGCSDSDILAGFDSAVEDGVDILSVSLGSTGPNPYWDDLLAIGAFGAMERGVLVSASAGNSGPASDSVTNIAPWLTTVGASTIDRTFPADLSLGDGIVIIGSSLYNGTRLSNLYPLIYAGNVSSFGVSTCLPGSLDAGQVHGKIVVCDDGDNGPVEKGLVVRDAGGVGVVVANRIGEDLLAHPYLNPGLAITMSARKKLLEYMTTNPNPQATMAFRGTQIGVKPAPVVAAFSSRGPNILSMNVLKPDLIAPGINILAAWPNNIPMSKVLEDPRRTEFNIISGTSMSCPHVSGIAALLKGVHRDWSPAIIKSALMTTAYTHDHDGKPLLDNKDLNVSDPWSMGAGHVDPMKAVDPGLVYNITVDDYIDFFCASGLTSKQIKAITKRAVECSTAKKSNPWDLNYPAISVVFNTSKPSDSKVVVTRTVTNVIDAACTYTVVVSNPKGVIVTVDPQKLVFGKIGEQKSYVVKISAKNVVIGTGKMLSHFGQLSWKDGSHNVTSPIVVTWI